jgi:hypothetical protein
LKINRRVWDGSNEFVEIQEENWNKKKQREDKLVGRNEKRNRRESRSGTNFGKLIKPDWSHVGSFLLENQ